MSKRDRRQRGPPGPFAAALRKWPCRSGAGSSSAAPDRTRCHSRHQTRCLAAVKAADLIGTLKGPGPFTVFAPTDAAFKKLPKGTVDNLLKPENKDKLVKVLTYHVLSGEVPSSEIAGKRLSATTVEGEKVHIDGRHGVKINMAHVVKADIPADNGVIHVIDEVLLPKM